MTKQTKGKKEESRRAYLERKIREKDEEIDKLQKEIFNMGPEPRP